MNSLKDKSVFIASSSEGLEVARSVKRQLSDISQVDLWNEGVFVLNRSNLDSLLRAADLYEYAIICLTADDILMMRGEDYDVARDNLLFELGLFVGRIGISKTFIIVDKEVKLPTDLDGIFVSKFHMPENGNLLSAVGNSCSEIRDEMIKVANRSLISYYPSTALAIGYFENFIQKVLSALRDKKEISIDNAPISYDKFSLKILIPDKIADVDREKNLHDTLTRFQEIKIKTIHRSYPFYLKSDTDSNNVDHLVTYDFPTTLVSSRKIIEMILKKDFIGDDLETKVLEKREIGNFKNALKVLTKDISEVQIEDYSKE